MGRGERGPGRAKRPRTLLREWGPRQYGVGGGSAGEEERAPHSPLRAPTPLLSIPPSTRSRTLGRRSSPSTHRDSGRHGGMQVESEERARGEEARCAGRSCVVSLSLSYLSLPAWTRAHSPRPRTLTSQFGAWSPAALTRTHGVCVRLSPVRWGPTQITPRHLASSRHTASPPPCAAAASGHLLPEALHDREGH